MRATKWIAILFVLCQAAFGNAYLVVPFSQLHAPGGPLPLGSGKHFRVQEIVGSGQFSTGQIIIHQIAFRAYPGTGPVNATALTLNLYLSTSQYFPNTNGGDTLITTTYATNLGPDNTLVYSGPVSFTSPGCAGPAVCSFDMVITFSTPFPYDPSKGRLLLDFQYASFTALGGSFDFRAYAFPNGGPLAMISGSSKYDVGNFAPGGMILQIGYTEPPGSACNTIGSSPYPCPIGGTLSLLSAPAGNLFGSGLGSGGSGTTVSFIDDPQNPGMFSTTTSPIQISDAAVPSLSETFSFATVSGQPAITGGSAAITCGVTGAATYSLTISSPGQTLVLNCPNLSTAGATANVSGRINFAPVRTLTLTLAFAGSAPTA